MGFWVGYTMHENVGYYPASNNYCRKWIAKNAFRGM